MAFGARLQKLSNPNELPFDRVADWKISLLNSSNLSQDNIRIYFVLVKHYFQKSLMELKIIRLEVIG
jgi:hypothetical protein